MFRALAAALVIAFGASARSSEPGVTNVSAAEVDRQTQTVAFPQGKALTIELTIGNVRIEGWDREQAEIVIERHAPNTAQFERLPLALQDTPSRMIVRAVQTGEGKDAALHSDVSVRLPRAALIERIQIAEGKLSIANFSGSIAADVRRGPIEAKDVSGGLIRLSSEIGSVTLSGAKLIEGGLLRLRTFNGDVRVTLAERPTNARIMALALNGNVKSDIPLTLRESWGPRWGETTLGNGTAVMNLDVVTGTVEIKSP